MDNPMLEDERPNVPGMVSVLLLKFMWSWNRWAGRGGRCHECKQVCLNDIDQLVLWLATRSKRAKRAIMSEASGARIDTYDMRIYTHETCHH